MREQVLSHFEKQLRGIQRVYVAVANPDKETDNQDQDEGRQKRKQETGIARDEDPVDEELREVRLNQTKGGADNAQHKRYYENCLVRPEILAEIPDLLVKWGIHRT
jgi:hypothetical protein